MTNDLDDKPIKGFRPDPQATSLLEGKPYTRHEHTDVQKTWRRFGWTPIYEKENHACKSM